MTEIDWNRYAQQYDYMCEYTPEYQKLLKNTSNRLKELNINPGNICEFGSGTGNFTIDALHYSFPDSSIVSVEYVSEFVDRQKKKIEKQNLENKIQLIQADIRNVQVEESSMDLVLMNHVLNFFNFEERDTIMRNISDSLVKGGYLTISDIGREINVFKWAIDIYSHNLKKHGLKKTIELYKNTSEVRRQNIQANKRQKKNISFMHNLVEFEDYVKSYGFKIIFSTDKYFGGIDDFIIAEKL